MVVTHPIPPVVADDSRVLLLGSFPSPMNREVGFFYGNPRNRFWAVLAGLWDEPAPAAEDAAELNRLRRDLCLRHHVALWDVLASCSIRGASDASIADPVPNDLAPLLARAPIARVFCTGSAAHALYRRFQEPAVGMPATRLPSTSPANARWRLPELLEAWRPVREAAEGRLP